MEDPVRQVSPCTASKSVLWHNSSEKQVGNMNFKKGHISSNMTSGILSHRKKKKDMLFITAKFGKQPKIQQ